MPLRIQLLGPPQVTRSGQALTFERHKDVALLAFLALTGGVQQRDALAAMLWPEADRARGRAYLSTALWGLRRRLDDDRLAADRHTVSLRPDGCWLDVALFDSLLAQAASHLHGPEELCPVCQPLLAQAAALYQDDFMAGFALGDSPLFDEWQRIQAERLRRAAIATLARLTQAAATAGEWPQALAFGRRWLAADRFNEAAARLVMGLHATLGETAAALRCYKTLERHLQQEVGLWPSPQTAALYRAIRRDAGRGEAFDFMNASPLGPPTGQGEASSPRPAPTWAGPPCPYRGLRAFAESDAPFYFGRETTTETLLDAVTASGLVALLGPSGSGKSSLVQAGLAPRLRQMAGWEVVTFRPGGRPLQALAAALGLDEEDRVQGSRGAITPAPYLPSPPAPLAGAWPGVEHLLLVVDQLEELFTLAPAAARRPFLDRLLALADQGVEARGSRGAEEQGSGGAEAQSPLRPRPPAPQHPITPAPPPPSTPAPLQLHLLLTLRADFLGQALAYRPLADGLQAADVKLGPMTTRELRQAIEAPARRQGVRFETGLVERILRDVGDEPGNLPLLEFALTLLWEEGLRDAKVTRGPGDKATPSESVTWSSSPLHLGAGSGQAAIFLTHRGYERIGRVEGALARYSDQVYRRLDEGQRQAARRVFLRLATAGEGTEATRRLATRDELAPGDWAVAQQLAAARLVVLGRDSAERETVEVAHEALIRHWGRLQGWLAQNQEFLLWRQRLHGALGLWQAAGRDEGAVLRGVSLAEAERWLGLRQADLGAAERAFIEESAGQRQRQVAAAEGERMARERGRRRFTTATVALAALAVAAAILALTLQQQAERQGRLATAREVALRAVEVMGRDPELGLLLALEAFNLTYERDGFYTAEARTAVNQALASPFRATLRGHQGPVTTVAFSPDGRWLMTAGADGTRLWPLAAEGVETAFLGQEGVTLSPPHPVTLSSLVLAGGFSPDGRWLATAAEDGAVRIWDLGDGVGAVREPPHDDARAVREPPLLLPGHEGPVTRVAFSPDSQRLVTAADDGARLWQTNDPFTLSPCHPVTLSPCHPPSLMAVLSRPGHLNPAIHTAVFSPDGALLATAGEGHLVWLWDGATGAFLKTLEGHTQRVNAAVFSPDGALLATAGEDGAVRLWHLEDAVGAVREPPLHALVLEGHEEAVTALAFSPDGMRLASASFDGTARIWNLAAADDRVTTEGDVTLSPGHPVTLSSLVLRGHVNVLRGVMFNPSGTRVATVSADNTVRLWDSGTGAYVATLSQHAGDINDLAFSPDGAWLATASSDGTVQVWSGHDNVLIGHTNWLFWVAYSPDGQQVATVSADGTARLWQTADGAPLAVLAGHKDWVQQGDFSPDGTRLVTGSRDGAPRLWQLGDGGWGMGDEEEPLPSLIPPPSSLVLEGHSAYVRRARFSPDGRLVATASWDETARLWDGRTGAPLAVLAGHTDDVWDLAFSPDGRQLLTGSLDGTARLWDLGDAVGAVREPPLHSLVLAGHSDRLEMVKFSADGRLALTASFDGTARLWQARCDDGSPAACRGGAELAVLAGHVGALRAVSISGDGRQVVTAGADGTARLWNLTTDEGRPTRDDQIPAAVGGQPSAVLVATLEGHTGGLSAADFSPDSRLVVTSSSDGTARLWRASDGALIAVLAGHRDRVWWVAFSPDGGQIATASFDNTARLWRPFVAVGEMLAEAQRRVGRALTPAECEHYLHRGC